MFDVDGCPVCKKLCCCGDKNPACQKKYHCYKKCEVFKSSKLNNSKSSTRKRGSKYSKSSMNGPLLVSPYVVPTTPTRTQTSLLVRPPLPEKVNRKAQHLLPLSLVLKNLHRLPPFPTASKPLLSSTSTFNSTVTNTNTKTLDDLLFERQKEEEKSQFSQCSHDSKSWGTGLSNSEQNSQPFSQSVFEKSLTSRLSSPNHHSSSKAFGSIDTLAEALEILNSHQQQCQHQQR